MSPTGAGKSKRRWLRLLASSALIALAGSALAQDAAALRARHAALANELASNAFARPLTLESVENGGHIEGQVHARIDQPFSIAGPALQGTARWCEILFLHLNVKQCRPLKGSAGERMLLVVGSKHDQPIGDAYRLDFSYAMVASTPDYLRLRLNADAGPMGTSDYRIDVELVALDDRRSFLHLSYSYEVGVAARLAMQAYLATVGRDKVGFSRIGPTTAGQPRYIGGTRGVVERNTMRYYLAIEAYLASLAQPAPRQFEQRLADWYESVERYPLQLHDMERGDYLTMKRELRLRQQAEGG